MVIRLNNRLGCREYLATGKKYFWDFQYTSGRGVLPGFGKLGSLPNVSDLRGIDLLVELGLELSIGAYKYVFKHFVLYE